MRYVLLILILNNQSIETEKIEFTTEKACHVAAQKLKETMSLSPDNSNFTMMMTCLDRGPKY